MYSLLSKSLKNLNMKVYKTGGYKELIEEVEAAKVTEKSVWLSNGRSLKRSHYANYWDTIEEAKKHLQEKYKRVIQASEDKIAQAKHNLEALNRY